MSEIKIETTKAPRIWVTNKASVRYKTICPKWLKEKEEELRRAETPGVAKRSDYQPMPDPIWEAILKVSGETGKTVREIMSSRRGKPLIDARHRAIHAAHKACPSMSYSALGRIFKRDHTTILYTLKKGLTNAQK